MDAVEKGYTKKNGKVVEDKTMWHNVVSTAPVCQYLKKGSLIEVVGSLTENNFQSKEGVEVKSYKVYATDIEFVYYGKKKESSMNGLEELQMPF